MYYLGIKSRRDGGSICHLKAYEQPRDLTRRDETSFGLYSDTYSVDYLGYDDLIVAIHQVQITSPILKLPKQLYEPFQAV
jgi:hypothetical protein